MMRVAGVAIMLAVMGCAHLEIEPVAVSDKTKQGLRFGKPVPYLSLGLSNGSCSGQIVWLPDPEVEYRADPQTGLFGSVDFKPTLQDGWMLQSFDSTSTTSLGDVVTALTGLFGGGASGAASAAEKAGGAAAPAAPPAGTGIAVGLYRINLTPGCDAANPAAANPCLKAVIVPNPHNTCEQFAGISGAAPAPSGGNAGGNADGETSRAAPPGGKKAH